MHDGDDANQSRSADRRSDNAIASEPSSAGSVAGDGKRLEMAVGSGPGAASMAG